MINEKRLRFTDKPSYDFCDGEPAFVVSGDKLTPELVSELNWKAMQLNADEFKAFVEESGLTMTPITKVSEDPFCEMFRNLHCQNLGTQIQLEHVRKAVVYNSWAFIIGWIGWLVLGGLFIKAVIK